MPFTQISQFLIILFFKKPEGFQSIQVWCLECKTI